MLMVEEAWVYLERKVCDSSGCSSPQVEYAAWSSTRWVHGLHWIRTTCCKEMSTEKSGAQKDMRKVYLIIRLL